MVIKFPIENFKKGGFSKLGINGPAGEIVIPNINLEKPLKLIQDKLLFILAQQEIKMKYPVNKN